MNFKSLEEKRLLSYFLSIVLKDQKQLNLPEIEQKVLAFWRENKAFSKTLSKSKKRKPFIFYEGPPTANGRPGFHHVLTRVFKDVICRYKTMRGFYVHRRAGWDTQGLPVEIEIEKQLDIKNKQDIEKYGIAKFNQKAKESVWKYKDDWEKLTERAGFWLDFEDAYITYENKYLEKLWWIFKEIDKRGLLKKFYKVVPWCPRCQTSLSSHELGQPGAYKKISDPSVYVKFKIINSTKTPEFLLIWTTTPWTLPANLAVAVNPELTYTKYKIDGELIWSAVTPPFSPDAKVQVVEKLSGRKLLGLKYEPLYQNIGPHEVMAADFVSAEEGTGLVHIASFGEDDVDLMRTCMKEFPVTIDDQGRMKGGLPGAGKHIKEADEDILIDLKKRNLLFHQTVIEHECPFCWRCLTALIYFPRFSWFIEMSKLRTDLLKENKKINWIPQHIKEGRFGEWIKDVKDWAISRERYWGTPLPIWECVQCSDKLVVGRLTDLNKHAYNRNKCWITRHAESEHNLKNEIAIDGEGRASQLTETGKRQADQEGQHLKRKKIDIIYCSPFLRTRQTAEIINKYLETKIVFDNRLAEINCGVFNGKTVAEHRRFFKEPLEQFTKKPPEGENWSDVRKRMMDFILEINQKHVGENILIISHGDPLWILETALAGLDDKASLAWANKNYLLVGTPKEIQLNNWSFDNDGRLDLHRPHIDKVILRCPKCKGQMKRIKDVADVWFDSGGMPFASEEYPDRYPADYICEAIDQTRGWFYTLLAIGVVLKKGRPYKNVISLGHILDKSGQKMSKSKGNVVDPWVVIDKYGIDVVRWYFYTVNPPGEPKKFDEIDLVKTRNKFHNPLYNSYAFYKTYKTPNIPDIKPDMRISDIHILDHWIWARLNETIDLTTNNLDKYEIGDAAKAIEIFVDDLSRWYIRRSRKRTEALPILGSVLVELAKLVAPFNPFLTDALYQSLRKGSVHLESWPVADRRRNNKNLLRQMAQIRRWSSLALAKRAEAGIKVRQPLASAKFPMPHSKFQISKELSNILKDEINVKEVIFDQNLKGEIVLDIKITPELKNEGLLRDLVRMIQELRHEAGYQPSDRVVLMMELPGEITNLVKENKYFKDEIKAKEVKFERSDQFDKSVTNKLDNQNLWLAVKK